MINPDDFSHSDRNCLVFDFDNFKLDIRSIAQPHGPKWHCPGCNLTPVAWFRSQVSLYINGGSEKVWNTDNADHDIVELSPVLAGAGAGFRHAGSSGVTCHHCGEKFFAFNGRGCSNPFCRLCGCPPMPAYRVQTEVPLWHDHVTHVHTLCPRPCDPAQTKTAVVVAVYGGIVAL